MGSGFKDALEIVVAVVLIVYAGPELAAAGYATAAHLATAVGISLVLNGVPGELVAPDACA
ncbi:MAG TPA: hypothetical protein VGM84_18130 [Steroidobacteraceae bacterium]|jgi:hypothetical protein